MQLKAQWNLDLSNFDTVFDITNDNLQPDQSDSKMYRKEPRYNEILVERKQSRSPNNNPEAQRNGEIRNFVRIQKGEFLEATKFVGWYILLPTIIKPVTQLLNGRYVHLRLYNRKF